MAFLQNLGGKAVRTPKKGRPPRCGPESTCDHTELSAGAQRGTSKIMLIEGDNVVAVQAKRGYTATPFLVAATVSLFKSPAANAASHNTARRRERLFCDL